MTWLLVWLALNVGFVADCWWRSRRAETWEAAQT
jgi:hypothetical protein